MRITRVHVPGPLVSGEEIRLPGPVQGHLQRVLRLRAGAPLVLFDGRGGEFRGTLSHCDRREARVRIADHLAVERESPLSVTLIQGVARGDRMDFTLQKATELGVTRVVCVLCERSMVRMDAARLEKKRAHWYGTLVAACEQCGRNRLPELAIRASLREALDSEMFAVPRLMLDPDASESIVAVGRAAGQATLVIGPEGGFSGAEHAVLMDAGFRPVRFGPRTLRTETAGLAALTAVQVLWGDLT